jgi:phosphatidylglycerol:prolipoprotein diacylglycerol transferase
MLTISIDPVAFTIGSLTVRWYGIIIALALAALLAMTLRESKRLGTSQDMIVTLFLWGVIGGFVLSRLIHVIDYVVINWEYYRLHPGGISEYIFGFSGLALYGAILGAPLGAWIYMRVKKLPFSSLAAAGDALAVGAPLAQAIGRIGCLLNGCCYGKPSPFSSFPGAIIYTARDTIPSQYWGVPLYPAQIYFLLWNLIVLATIWLLRGRIKPQGSLFFLYLCLYAAGDFGLRFFRVNEPFFMGLQQGQVVSLAILVVVVPWLIIRMRRARQTGQNHEV